VGTEIPCRGPFQPIYRNLNGPWIATNPVLQLATTPVDVVELMKEWDEVKPDNDQKLDFVYGCIYNMAVHPQWSWCHGTWPPLHRAGGHQVDVLGPLGGFR
jgi:hypothetical protein